MLLKKELKGHKRVLPNGTVVINHSHSERKNIVGLIESGELTIEDAMKKYQVKNRGTIYRWIREHSKNKNKYKVKKRATTQQKIEAVTAYDQGRKEKHEICKELNITENTLKQWVISYSCLPQKDQRINEMDHLSNRSNQESEKFKQALEEAKLRIMGLETMIEIAEKEFNIPIRKKCGTKQ
jgi:transposase-like protein